MPGPDGEGADRGADEEAVAADVVEGSRGVFQPFWGDINELGFDPRDISGWVMLFANAESMDASPRNAPLMFNFFRVEVQRCQITRGS